MNQKISQAIKKSQHQKFPRIALLTEVIPRQTVIQVLEQTGTKETRNRKLCSELVIWICILMNWMPRRAIPSVMAKLCLITSLGNQHPTRFMATASGISQARYRVGARPLALLFKQVCRPLATSETQGAFLYDRRLVAFDGTLEQIADTPENERYFGRSSGSYGDNAFPQLRAVYACELGTHIIFDAVLGSYRDRGEHTLARRLLRCVQDDMLVLLDAGLSSFDLINGIVSRGGAVLARANVQRHFHAHRFLADGSFLAFIHPSDKSQDTRSQPVEVRVLRYQIDDPTRSHHGEIQTLITTLLDPDTYPALDLIEAYHQRWEIEVAIDEMDSHQRLANRPLRSLKPVGVIQEFYAFLLGYFVIRAIMLRTAQRATLDPDRLSFTETIHLLVDSFPLFQLCDPHQHTYLLDWLMDWIICFQLPIRRDRSNPRVIKKRRTKFPRKRPHHFAVSHPCKSFREAVIMLT